MTQSPRPAEQKPLSYVEHLWLENESMAPVPGHSEAAKFSREQRIRRLVHLSAASQALGFTHFEESDRRRGGGENRRWYLNRRKIEPDHAAWQKGTSDLQVILPNEAHLTTLATEAYNGIHRSLPTVAGESIPRHLHELNQALLDITQSAIGKHMTGSDAFNQLGLEQLPQTRTAMDMAAEIGRQMRREGLTSNPQVRSAIVSYLRQQAAQAKETR